ncbi:TetR/AcrR family transcriptional regulator [Mycobacterium sp. 2YAF39]|uniref:TetR/AcrR family transcriptional regulator n=1 Tax=Mycobacterium sp. 2YAF39 TaxID=3233033 RepID=UPI003F9C0906
MAAKPRTRTSPRRNVERAQQRADRTRELVINETINCVREEGFAAASTRHIIERAGVSTGVIQYHFGDRDGLLTAVIDHAVTTLIESINDLTERVGDIADDDERLKALVAAAWEAFHSPASMSAMEILIATRSLRDTLAVEQLIELQPGLARIAELIGGSSTDSAAIADLLWAAPIGLMVGQMVTNQPLPTEPQQQAMAKLIADHLRASPTKRTGRGTRRTRSRKLGSSPPATRA